MKFGKLFLNEPYLGKEEKKYLNGVIDKNWLSINGEYTKKFENKICSFLNRKYALAVQSGTASIHASLKALGVKENDNVILPNYTCVSNLSAVKQLNANPIIVEVEKETLGLDFENVKKAILKYKPKVLQIVHVYGFPARDTVKILSFCKKYKVKVLEDASEALGAKLNKKRIGSFGDISIFSIRSEKMIGVGEGGVITTSKKKIFDKIKLICSRHSPFRSKYDPYWKKYFCNGEGYNYLMPHLLGAVALAQFERFEKFILKKKIYIGETYFKNFNNKDMKSTQLKLNNSEPAYWLNSIYFLKLNAKKVQKIGNQLMKKGIEVRSGFWPMNELYYFKSKTVDIGNKKISKNIFNKSLVLPSSVFLNEEKIKYIKAQIQNILKKIK
tara:strand:- start:137 stop:1291 length:1155 start_codon:yes stop_codon:yes gene_type:complete